jgi:rod shape-determining protein MreD
MKPPERRGPRILATALIGFLLLVLSTTVLAWWRIGPIRLQPMMVIAVSAGFNLPLGSGGILVMLLGCMADVVSGGFLGLNLSGYMAAFLVSAVAQRGLNITSWPFQMIAVGLFTLVGQLLVLGGLYVADRPFLAPANLWLALAAQAVISAVAAPLFFWILERLVTRLDSIWPSGDRGVT